MLPLLLLVLAPLPQDRALLPLQPLQLLQLLPLLLLPLAGMIRGLSLLLHLLITRGHPRGPHLQRGLGLRARVSHLVQGPRSLIPQLFKDQLMISPRICLLLLLFGAPSSIAASLQTIQIVVPGKCTTRHYGFPAFAVNPKLRDSMRLVQRYSLEPFMTPCRFFYPWVVMEFYHTMTFRGVPHPIAIHFSIDGSHPPSTLYSFIGHAHNNNNRFSSSLSSSSSACPGRG